MTPDKLWVLCWEDIRTGEKGDCIGQEAIKQYFFTNRNTVFVGHNFVKWDAVHLNRLVDAGITINRIVDTLILSTLYSPSIVGGHSLEAWAARMGGADQKVQHEDWSQFSPQMLERCRSDVRITKNLFIRITAVLAKLGFSEKTCEIQHKMTNIIRRQQDNGFFFDGPRAVSFLVGLRSRENELKEEIYHAFPSRRTKTRSFSRAFKADGSHSQSFLKHNLEFPELRLREDGGYDGFEDVQFNLGSPKQRVEKLLELGWIPTEFTPTGQPKATEKGLVEFAEQCGVPEVALITKWMAINGRGNMVNTWLDNWNEKTGCIHGSLFVADTLRFRHQKPNTANIPAVRIGEDGQPILGEQGYYTYESRDLWCARPGRVLVGTDAAGLELRMLAHYLNNPEFTEQVIYGDPHQYNADMVGITRPRAKTILYASMYGASGKKIAKTLGISVSEGTDILNTFLDRLGITDLIKEVKKEQAKGRIELIDGAQIICPSPHAALNYKLQGGGARVCQNASIILEASIRKEKLDSLAVGNIHDEVQYDVDPDHSDKHSEIANQSFTDSGTDLNMNVPIAATSKKGFTWSETH